MGASGNIRLTCPACGKVWIFQSPRLSYGQYEQSEISTEEALAIDGEEIICGWLINLGNAGLPVDVFNKGGCGARLVLRAPAEIPREVALKVEVVS